MQFRAFEMYASQMGLAVGITPEPQNSDYESGVAQIDDEVWHIRTARNTPRKPGAFVAFWRRDVHGLTTPFSDDDLSTGLLVFVGQEGRRGVFRLPAARLAELGITSGRQPGKRGFRVYPSWCAGLNAQAAATQHAQASTFQEY